MKYEPALDGLRGVAVTLVFLCHFGVLDAGWIGVQLFFVLSGYLITGILLGELQFPTRLYLARFYVRRTLRIFPLYYAYLAGLAVLDWLLPARLFAPERADIHEQAVPLVTYTLNFAQLAGSYSSSHLYHHFWSLAVEEQFYLVWPWVVRSSGRERLRRVCLVVMLAAPLLRWVSRWFVPLLGASSDRGLVAAYGLPLCQADGFALGAFLALRLGDSIVFPPVVSSRMAAVVVGLVALNATSLRLGDLGPVSALGLPSLLPWNGQYVWGYTVVDVLALWMLERARSEGSLQRALASPWLVYLGRRSYALYVLHYPILDILGRVLPWRTFPERWLALPVLFLSVIAAAEVTYWTVERPFLTQKDRLTPKPRPRAGKVQPTAA